MRCTERLREHLVANGVGFEFEQHRVAYTAQDLAAVEHVSGKRVAKVVVVIADGKPVMLVLPASGHVDLEKVRSELGVGEARLAREEEFAATFQDCEVGAMPPFGSLYGVPVYADSGLATAGEITFPAGSHRESVRIKYSDFERMEQPRQISFVSKTHITA